ncbi:MurR/RpiR family transcriptional regulator [Isobaculum melis]|uniref:DNA-binding transcriptional regulator, MurR/RpiR family, contains HTH and SIS domains n=1 Tax=Isobaculum melis TaxID=142588 RepID=A0A1H9U9P1_9LACT|nr:MurR/RpiR family transcriptional regulator [Isobaculum melis]SES06052.1 DNA-binding transcriptional regulator, MurR/RpiR family, contains HTH and SIS domains [Isobaculum melis]
MINLMQLIKDHYDQYTPQEKIVADNLLEFPRFILEKNISSLAASINVSRNSITRFCKTLGFSGYTEFKYEFSKYITQQSDRKNQKQTGLVADIIEAYKGKLDEIPAQNFIQDEDVFYLAEEICKASSVKIIGTGKSVPPALQLKYSLQTLEVYVQMMDSLYFSDDLSFLFNEDDVVLVYSVSGKSLATNQVLAGALKAKAKVFMITTAKKLSLDVEKMLILPNVSKNNPFIFSNHTLFYIFNDLLCNAISYYKKEA